MDAIRAEAAAARDTDWVQILGLYEVLAPDGRMRDLVASGLCDWVEIQMAYAIGVADPVSVTVERPLEILWHGACLSNASTDPQPDESSIELSPPRSPRAW